MPRGSNPFLTVFVVRLNSGSRDIVLKRALVDIDDLEIDIDADMLNGLNVSTPQLSVPVQTAAPLPLKGNYIFESLVLLSSAN